MLKSSIEHPCFPQLAANEKIWRYMSLAKLINLITEKKIYLTRLDLLDDPYEGSYPMTNSSRLYSSISPEGKKKKLESNLKIRKSLYVNCWRYGIHESEAMWKLYCSNNDGIAIQTSYKKLIDSINVKDVFAGSITYIDYESDSFKFGNVLYPAMHKRKAFEHENEMRIVMLDTRYWAEKLPDDLPEPNKGLTIDWDMEEHCETLYINPYASQWYYETVTQLMKTLGIKISIKWSNLKATPLY